MSAADPVVPMDAVGVGRRTLQRIGLLLFLAKVQSGVMDYQKSQCRVFSRAAIHEHASVRSSAVRLKRREVSLFMGTDF